MSRRAARVTQADIARALRAVEQTGARASVEVTPDGTIRIVPIEALAPLPGPPTAPVEPEHEIIL
jgi:hypothetical protein